MKKFQTLKKDEAPINGISLFLNNCKSDWQTDLQKSDIVASVKSELTKTQKLKNKKSVHNYCRKPGSIS